MKQTLLKTFILLILSATISAKPFLWIASRVSDKIQTNYDINKYSELIYLDDQKKSELFEKAQKDLNKYQELVNEYTEKYFEKSLRQLTYYTIVEKEATKGKKENWKAFKVTLDEYMDEVRKIEDEVLKKYSDGKGIVHASTEYGKELIKNNFPHELGMDPRDLYYEWLKLQKKRIKEKFRIREVQRFESIMARKFNPTLRLSPIATHDFIVENTKKINESLQNKYLSRQEVEKILLDNPEYNVIIDGITYVSIDESPLSKVKETSEEMYQNITKEINKRVLPALNQERIDKVLHYENLAQKLANKYETVEKLEELSKEAMGRFLQGNGNYNDFMLARLYTLASVLIDTKPNRDAVRNEITAYTQKMLTKFKEVITNEEWLLTGEHAELRLENRIARILTELYEDEVSRESNLYLRESLAMAVWTLKFEVKKLTTLFKPMVSVVISDRKNWDSVKKVQDYLKMEIYKEGVERFRNQDLRWWTGIFEVNINGTHVLRGENAVNFLLEK